MKVLPKVREMALQERLTRFSVRYRRVLCFTAFSLIAFIAMSTPTVVAAAQPSATQPSTALILPPNQSLIDGRLDKFRLVRRGVANASSTIVPIPTPTSTPVSDAPEFGQALRVENRLHQTNAFDVQCVLKLPAVSLRKGDIIWASAWARMLRTEDESGQGVLGFVVERSHEPFDKLIYRRVSIGPQWQQLSFPARVHADLPAGDVQLALQFGDAQQMLEIGGLQLIRFDDPAAIDLQQLPQTRITYGGREADAAWRTAADQRIDTIRKAPLTVRVIDAAGHPIAGATVRVDMQRQAFPFGCVYNPSALVGREATSPDNREYARHFAALFNSGTDEYAMKWASWDKPATGDLAIEAVDWMNAHGVRVRGHCLVWPGWRHLPPSLAALKDNPSQLAQRVDAHILDEAGTLSGRVAEWDVVNEPFANNDLMKILGDGAMADWFKLAHDADPSARLILNETNVPTNPPSDPHYDSLFKQVQEIQKAGGPIGGVGMQAHFGSALTSIADLAHIYQRFASLGIPLEITELDIDVNDDQLQADYLRDFMTFSFSEPNISGLTMWGFVENHHWRPDAALWHADWKIKPAGQAWLDLVKKKWWTRANLESAADGTASVRAFLGDYLITVTAGTLTTSVRATLPHDGCSAEVVLSGRRQ